MDDVQLYHNRAASLYILYVPFLDYTLDFVSDAFQSKKTF